MWYFTLENLCCLILSHKTLGVVLTRSGWVSRKSLSVVLSHSSLKDAIKLFNSIDNFLVFVYFSHFSYIQGLIITIQFTCNPLYCSSILITFPTTLVYHLILFTIYHLKYCVFYDLFLLLNSKTGLFISMKLSIFYLIFFLPLCTASASGIYSFFYNIINYNWQERGNQLIFIVFLSTNPTIHYFFIFYGRFFVLA